ncbi:MAG: long-chain fatty acid--CoA ligase [Vicingaceae bacterium]
MKAEDWRIFDLHQHQVDTYPKSDSLASKVDGEWKKYSTVDFIELANQLSTGLMKLGLKKGDMVAIVGNNRPEWHIADLAMLQIGLVTVPLYPTITEEDYAYILNDSEAKLVFASSEDLVSKMKNVLPLVPSLTHLFSFDQVKDTANWKELLSAEKDLDGINAVRNSIQAIDLATLIYTSGTTGKPKGVMLSHRNLVSNVLASKERLPCDHNGKSLSFLPLCHVYERMVCYLYIYNGVSIYYAESMETIGDNLKEVKPQVFTAVPRLLEKIYDKIVAKGSELTGIKKTLFFWALKLGHNYEIHGKGPFYKMQLSLANKLIFSKWREALGGNAQAVASGSAALQPRLARVFLAAQIPIMEGYGLTETSPVIAVNCEKDDGVRIGTVGRPLPNVEVKIAEDGEIIVRGPNVMLGYYKKEGATREVLSEDGWLHTGDIGEFQEGNFLKITDRKKEIFKTSGGKYIAPQVMENKFKESLFIDQIMVIGENRKHPAALIQLNFEFAEEWCKRKKYAFTSKDEMLRDDRVIDRVQQEVDHYNEFYAKYEKIKKFRLTKDVWSVEGGEMTPTLKLRRKHILQKYADLVEEIYTDEVGDK